MSIPPEAFTSYMNSINAPSPRELVNSHLFSDKKKTFKSMDCVTSEIVKSTEKMNTSKDSLSINKEENGWEHVSQKSKKSSNINSRLLTTSIDTYSAKKVIRSNNPLNQSWRDNSSIFPDRDKKSFRCPEKYFPGKSGVMRSEIDDNWRADNKKIFDTNIYPTNIQQSKNSKDISYAKETELTGNERNWNKETSLINEKKVCDNKIYDSSKINILQNDVYKNAIKDEIFNINNQSEFNPLNSSLDNIFHQNDRLHINTFSEPLSNINNNVLLQNNGNAFETLLQSLNIDNDKQQFVETFSNNLLYSENDTTIQSHNLFDSFKDNLDVPNDYLSQISTKLTSSEDYQQHHNNNSTSTTALGHSEYLSGHIGNSLDTSIMNNSFNNTRKTQNPVMNIQNNIDINPNLVTNNLFNIPPVSVANNNPLQNLPDQLIPNFNTNPIINGGNMFMNNPVNYLRLLSLGFNEEIIQSLFQMSAFSQLLQCTNWFNQRENLRWICMNDIGDIKGPFCAQDLIFKLINFHIPPLLKFHCEQLPFNGWLTLVELIRAADDRIPFISAYFPRTREEYSIIQKILKGVGEIPNSSKWIYFFQNEEKIMKQASRLFEVHISQIVANLRTNPVLQKTNLQLTTEQFKDYVNTNFLTQRYQKDKIKTGNFNQQSSNFDDINKTQTVSHNINFNSDLQISNFSQDLVGKQLYNQQQRSNYFQSGNKTTNNVVNNSEIQKNETNDNNQQQIPTLKQSHTKKSIGDNKEQEIPTFHCGTWVPQNTKKKSFNKNSNYNNNGNYQHTEYHGRTNIQKPTLLSSSKNWESPNIKPDDDIPTGKVPIGLSLGEFLAPATGQTIERPLPQHSATTPNSRSYNYSWNNSNENRNTTVQVKQNEIVENKPLSTSPTTLVRPVGAVWKNDNKNNGSGSNKGSSSSNKNTNTQSTFGAEEAANELQQWLFDKFKSHKSESDVMAFCQFISNVDNPADIEDYFSTNFGDSVEVRKVYREYIEKRNEVRSRVIKAKSGQDDLSAPAQAIGFTAQPVKKNKKKSG
ncbi:Hypothetical protein SRAE_X000259400 [Strongyloides ratti]|uniref:Uncharacterized protein n=1 Tax=Strongyloides ratti TaxID=34506 RepID=A0A090KYA9_STRRB|nr:Hypothetical protein SRAE_X000259400 [Strongyloides ratti]CEF60862.1 Hypothetical protein SRAE_X000259400 [Strongyloides ratti]